MSATQLKENRAKLSDRLSDPDLGDNSKVIYREKIAEIDAQLQAMEDMKDEPSEKKTSAPTTTATKPKSAPAKKVSKTTTGVPCADVNQELAKVKAENRELKKVTTAAQEKVAEKAAEAKVASGKSEKASTKKKKKKKTSSTSSTTGKASSTTTAEASSATTGKTSKSKAKSSEGKASTAKTKATKAKSEDSRKEVSGFSIGYLVCRRAVGMNDRTLNRDTVKSFYNEHNSKIEAEIYHKKMLHADEILLVVNTLKKALFNSEDKKVVKIKFTDAQMAQLRAVKERLVQTVVFMNQYLDISKDKDKVASWLERVEKAKKKGLISYDTKQGKKLRDIVDNLKYGKTNDITSREFLSGVRSLGSIFTAKKK